MGIIFDEFPGASVAFDVGEDFELSGLERKSGLGEAIPQRHGQTKGRHGLRQGQI